MVETLLRYRAQGRFLLHAFVVMPDHLHVVFSPAQSLEQAVGLLKGGYSFAVRKTYRAGPSGKTATTRTESRMDAITTRKSCTLPRTHRGVATRRTPTCTRNGWIGSIPSRSISAAETALLRYARYLGGLKRGWSGEQMLRPTPSGSQWTAIYYSCR
jgi:hypothetical protein